MTPFEPLMRTDEPIHERVYRYLASLIVDGGLSEGERLPSESELQRRFGVSRTPIRQALRRLQSSGVVIRAQGRGTFVATTKLEGALRHMVGFGQDLRRLGHHVAARTLRVMSAVPAAEVRATLHSRENEPVAFVERLFIVDGEPLGIFQHWLTPRINVDEVRAAGDFPSFTELMARYGFEPYRGTEYVGAAAADDRQAELLDCAVGSPLLAMRRISSDIEREPVEYTTYYVRADRYEYQINLVGSHR